MVENISATVKLHDGADMPGFGFGCYKASGPELALAVREAVACGYRYIDTASYYHNEDTVGEALRHSGLAREKLFVLSKIWPAEYDEPVRALDQSLRLLGLDYLDGYLLHWPGQDNARRLRAFEQLLRQKEAGKIRVLGVSNFLEVQLSELHDVFGFWPVINQIEVHPLFSQAGLCRFCAQWGIQVISWSPLGRGREMENALVRGLAADLGRTPAQILLRWHLEKGLLPIPKSVHVQRVRENAAVFDFRLTPEQVEALDGLHLSDDQGRIGPDPLLYPR